MAGPGLPCPSLPPGIDTLYADSGTDGSVKTHQQHHDTVHTYVNKLDSTALSGVNGQYLGYGAGNLLVPIAAPIGSSGSSGIVRTPEQYGAVGNGIADDTTALNNVIAACNAGDTIAIVAGKIYRHTASLSINKAGITIKGYGVIYGSAEATSGVWISADNITIDGVTFRVGPTTQRWQTIDQHKLTLNTSVSGAIVRNVIIDGSAGAGIFVYGATNYVISDVIVRNTRADAIHNTHGSTNGLIQRPIVRNPGDDGVAIVSYEDTVIPPCSNIHVQSPKLFASTWGRGISVVGGQNIVFSDIYIWRSAAAAVYIACESSYTTFGVSNVWVMGGEIRNANTDTSVNHGAVLVNNSRAGFSITDVYIEGLRIYDTRSTANRDVGVLQNAGTISRIQLADIAITAGTGSPYLGTATLVNRTGWTQDGTPLTDSVMF